MHAILTPECQSTSAVSLETTDLYCQMEQECQGILQNVYCNLQEKNKSRKEDQMCYINEIFKF